MITSFEVGAIFRIVNEATRPLQAILKQVRELNAAIDKARENLALLTKPLGLNSAIAETDRLAASWGRVAESAAAARRKMGEAAGMPLAGGGLAIPHGPAEHSGG